jgi:hypothetical protein
MGICLRRQVRVPVNTTLSQFLYGAYRQTIRNLEMRIQHGSDFAERLGLLLEMAIYLRWCVPTVIPEMRLSTSDLFCYLDFRAHARARWHRRRGRKFGPKKFRRRVEVFGAHPRSSIMRRPRVDREDDRAPGKGEPDLQKGLHFTSRLDDSFHPKRTLGPRGRQVLPALTATLPLSACRRVRSGTEAQR